MMFKQEKDHLEAQEKVLELVTQIYDVLTQTSGVVTNKDIIKF